MPSFECPECHQMLSSEINLALHRFNMHGVSDPSLGLVGCGACGKWFATGTLLADHQKAMHDIPDEYTPPPPAISDSEPDPKDPVTLKYPCPLCDRSYRTELSMLKHRYAIHEDIPDPRTPVREFSGGCFSWS